MTIAIDLDDTCNYFLRSLVSEYNKLNGTSFSEEDITDWDITKSLGQEGLDLFHEPGFFINCPPREDCLEVTARLAKDHNLLIVSSLPRRAVTAAYEKFKWVERHLPFIKEDNIILTSGKMNVNADILIDDRDKNISSFSRENKKTIMIDMPHNRAYQKERYLYNSTELERVKVNLYGTSFLVCDWYQIERIIGGL